MSNIRIRTAVIIVKDEQVLLVEHQKNGQYYWLLPGGGAEFNEDLITCAKRELKEEANIDIEVKNLAFISETIAPDNSRHIMHVVFFAEHIGGTIQVGEEERLHSIKYVKLSELKNLTLYPPIAEQITDAVLKKSAPSYLGNLWVD